VRIAKMERCDPSVSIDLLIKSLLALGTTRRELARAIAWKGQVGKSGKPQIHAASRSTHDASRLTRPPAALLLLTCRLSLVAPKPAYPRAAPGWPG